MTPEEHNSNSAGLSDADKDKLSHWKTTHRQLTPNLLSFKPECHQSKRTNLPFINEATYDYLRDEYGLNNKFTQIEFGNQYEFGQIGIIYPHQEQIKIVPAFTQAAAIAGDEFSLIKDTDFFAYVDQWIDERSLIYDKRQKRTTIDKDKVDAMTVGFGIVLKAFHKQLGPEIIDRLGTLPESLLKVLFSESEDPNENEMLSGGRISILQKVSGEESINPTRLPISQLFLGQILNEIIDISPPIFREYILAGAMQMYKVMENAWPKLSR